MVAYVHIEYSTHQFSEETKGGWNPPPPGPCGTEKSVVLRGLRPLIRSRAVTIRIFLFRKDLFSFMRAQHVVSCHVI